jgi:hypothetical protein
MIDAHYFRAKLMDQIKRMGRTPTVTLAADYWS